MLFVDIVTNNEGLNYEFRYTKNNATPKSLESRTPTVSTVKDIFVATKKLFFLFIVNWILLLVSETRPFVPNRASKAACVELQNPPGSRGPQESIQGQ